MPVDICSGTEELWHLSEQLIAHLVQYVSSIQAECRIASAARIVCKLQCTTVEASSNLGYLFQPAGHASGRV